MEVLKCPNCQLLLMEPVTVACGHSFCKRCLQGAAADGCQVCKQRLKIRGDQDLKCNTLLCNLLEKCLQPENNVKRIKRDLQELISSQEYEEAAKLAAKGTVLAPEDVPLRILRSQVYLELKQYPEALREAEVICRLQKQDPEGFYRKGLALVHMDEKQEALVHFHQCLMLNPHFSEAQREIEQLEGASGKEQKSPCDMTRSDLTSLSQNHRKHKNTEAQSPTDKGRLNTEEKDENPLQSSPSLQDLMSLSDVECSLCIRMFLEPVTTPCGHTFCRECLERCLDHQPYCPLCKQSLKEFLRVGCYSITFLLQELMSTIFPSEMDERKQLHLSEIAELSNLVRNVPIFVCTLAFPGIPCPLHVFEPRYRLMMRRCLETGTKSFGMCLYESGKSFADYGCMLEILHLDYLPDGRSFVETVGRRRFKVKQRGHLDGYHTAEVEYLADRRLEGEELQEVELLNNTVYEQLQECFIQHRRVFKDHGNPPPKADNVQESPDGPLWCWWLLSLLPLDPNYQMFIFSRTSLKDRLIQLKHILSVLQNRP
uniref:Uncharacterized protein n=1 Tax=Leptobrachium leishanense TaxID=445787 RepID=A0A8C5M0R9_9ANUR